VQQSFTCCVNHAQYTCPSTDDLTSCATSQPNHCTPAGSC
jgi:hypothetical protein